MGRSEEAALLLRTGCPSANVDALLRFAGTYRTRMVPSDGALRVRRLGTRALLRIARRLARFPWDQDIRRMLERALLTEFLPTTEKVGVEELLEDAGIKKISPAVRASSSATVGVYRDCTVVPPRAANRRKSAVVSRADRSATTY